MSEASHDTFPLNITLTLTSTAAKITTQGGRYMLPHGL